MITNETSYNSYIDQHVEQQWLKLDSGYKLEQDSDYRMALDSAYRWVPGLAQNMDLGHWWVLLTKQWI